MFDDSSYLFVNEKEIFKCNAVKKNVNFAIQFCLGSIYNAFRTTDLREASFKWNVNDFEGNYNSIIKSDILNIHKHLITKNNIK